MAVFEQRGGAHGYWRLHCVEEGEEVGYERVGQLGAQEVFEYDVVGSVAQCYLVEVVGIHELVEDVGAEHHGSWYGHLNPRQLVHLRMSLYDVVEESQSTSFSSERSVANSCEVAVSVEFSPVEHSHDTDVFHLSVLHYGLENDLSVCLYIL